MMRIIVCGPIGYGGKEKIEELQKFLRDHGFEVLDQLEEMDYSSVDDFRDKEELSRKILERDLKRVSQADVLVLVADSPSFGAAMEAFYAAMKGKKIVAYAEEKTRSPWPIAIAHEVCRTKEELLRSLKENEVSFRKIPNVFGDHEAEFVYENFRCICPVTGKEDRATIKIRYIPDRWIIEYESLNSYFRSFERRRLHHEAVVEEIFSTIKRDISPKELEVIGEFEERSGVRAKVRKRS